jgi:hypothetical protein
MAMSVSVRFLHHTTANVSIEGLERVSGGVRVRRFGQNAREGTGWRLLADAHEKEGRLSDALAALERYADLVPGDIGANNRRVELKQRISGSR